MIRFRPGSPQRDLMRTIFATVGDDRDAVCAAYIAAERGGRVARPRGAEDLTPGIHAKALWQEGKLKAWLRS